MIIALRSLLFSVWLYGWGIILGILFLPLILFGQRGVMFAIRVWARVSRFGMRALGGARVELRGLENVPQGACLCAGKHQSTMDVIVGFLLVPAPVAIMKRELLWYPVFGWYALFGRNIPIDRGAKVSAIRKMRKIAKQRTEEGRQIMIFPEGTRRKPGAEPNYKSGVFGIYDTLGVPVVPIATNSGLCWHRGFLVKPGVIVYEALTAIEPGLDRQTFMGRLEQETERACERLLDEGLAVQGRTRAEL